MSTTDDMRIEIDKLKLELTNLEGMRLERDHILGQRKKLDEEIVAKKEALEALEKEIGDVKNRKTEEENRKNEQIELGLRYIFDKKKELRDREIKIQQAEEEHTSINAELTQQKAQIEARTEIVFGRETNCALHEKDLAKAKNEHAEKASIHEIKVSDHVSRETALTIRENDIVTRETKHAENLKQLARDREILNIDKRNIEEKAKNLQKINDEISLKRVDVEEISQKTQKSISENNVKEIELVEHEKKLEKDTEALKVASESITLRELENQNRERLLEKRERIIALKNGN